MVAAVAEARDPNAQPGVVWREDEHGRLRAYLKSDPKRKIAWTPQAGSQYRFLQSTVTETLYAGTRGPGKTDALLMDFAQFVGRGFGADWRGILFRRTFPELQDIIAKSQRWFTEIFPLATFNQATHTWRWPTGEVLIFSFMKKASDYYRFHGHAYPWIGWEELTTWPSDECFRLMLSCLRSTNPKVPRRVRSTTNPYGVGHNWVKARYQLPVPHGRFMGPLIRHVPKPGQPKQPDRIAFHGALHENKVLLHADPEYIGRIVAAASNPSQEKAWREGSWDIVSGGMFDDIWDPAIHVVPPVPIASIPAGWRLDRAYDDGLSRPFSVGWWAQSNGEPITWEGRRIGEVKGDLIRVAEWYGWTGQENTGLQLSSREIALGIVEREELWGVRGRVKAGPADGAIFNSDPRDPANSIATDMQKLGVSWELADKSAGSRHQGWKAIRQMLKAAIPGKGGRREYPGLFCSLNCPQFLRTMPVMPRDEKDPDDVDTEAEDHIADETRYRCRRPRVVEESTPHLVF